jgi:serine phosphatase RsbU (regulator of sigma subunit)
MSSLHGRKEEMERELAIGRQIQAGFLPLTLPRPPGWELAARFEPAKEVAGDFYDAFPLPGGLLLGIVIADVSGKGVGAALFVALTRTLLRAYAEHNFAQLRAGEQMDGDAVARAIATTVSGTNDYVAGVHGSAHMFATVFFGVLDVSAGDLRYCSAGHDPPAITGEAGIRATLMPTGPAVGLLPGMPFAVERAQIAQGEMLAMYTDGVTDAQDANGLMFGKDALMALIGEPPGTAAALVERIEASLKAHIAGAAQFDDITLLAVKRSPAEPAGA